MEIADIVGKSSNNNSFENDSLQQEQDEELDMYDEDVEIEKLDEYSNTVKYELLDSGVNIFLLLSNNNLRINSELKLKDNCSSSVIEYLKVCSEIYKIIPYSSNLCLTSCFLASLLFENKTTTFFSNHGVSFKKCMMALGKSEKKLLEKSSPSFDDAGIIENIFLYLTKALGVNFTRNTLINDFMFDILDTNKTASYEIEYVVSKVNPKIKIEDNLLSTIQKYNENYQKELYAKKYNEVFGNVSENTIECIKYAYEIYCEVLKGSIEKLSSIRQELDKLSLITAILENSEITTEKMRFVINSNKCKNYLDIDIENMPTTKEKLSIKDLDEISNLYGRYIKDENGINLEAIAIFNNLIHEYNWDKAYEEYRIKTEEDLKKKERKMIQETLDKIYKYEFSDYIITSYKIFKRLYPKLLPEKDDETNNGIRFAYSLFLGVFCCDHNNLIEDYLRENNINFLEAIKIFGLNPNEYCEYLINPIDEEIDSDISNYWSKIDNDIFIIDRTSEIIRCDKDIKSVEEFFLKTENIMKPITDYFNLSWQDLIRYVKLKSFSNIPVLRANFDNTIILANYGNSLLPLVEEINRVSQDSIKIDIDIDQTNTILCTLEFNKRKNFFRWLIREKTPTINKETIDKIDKLFNEQLTIFEEEARECNYLKKLIAIYIEKIEEHIKVIEEEIETCENLSKRDKKSASGKMLADDIKSKKEQLKCKITDFNTGIIAMLNNYKQTSQAEKLAGIYMSRINICINAIIPSLYNHLLISNFLVKQQEVSTAISFVSDMLNGMVNLNNKGLIKSLESANGDDSFDKLVPAIPEQLQPVLREIENDKLGEESKSETQKVIRRSF